MTWQRYLTDVERKYRPQAMQTLYCFPLAFTIKGVTFIRWFRSEEERERYRTMELPNGVLARLIDRTEEDNGNTG